MKDERILSSSKDEKGEDNDEESREYIKNSNAGSFNYMISFSDSLVLGSIQDELFIKQLTNYLATVYIETSKPFRKPFERIEDVKNESIIDYSIGGELRSPGAFPVLFRGGLSKGENIQFF